MLITRPFGDSSGFSEATDIASIAYDHQQGLRIHILGAENADHHIQGLKVAFSRVSGFRCLSELDLIHYWQSPQLIRGYCVLEVISGGWGDEHSQLLPQAYTTQRQREWLVVTGHVCVSVWSDTAPSIQPTQWPVSTTP